MLVPDLLENEPLVIQIHNALENYIPASTLDELAVISALLKYTVPGIYQQLPEETKEVVANVFRSAVGIGNIIGRISLLFSLRADTLGDIVNLLNVHMYLLERVLAPAFVLEACKDTRSLREVDKILYKGKCFSVVREMDMKFENLYVPPVLGSMTAYSTFLSQELIRMYGKCEISQINTLLWSLMSLGDLQKPYFDVIFLRNTLSLLHESVMKMKRFERKQILLKFLDWIQGRFGTLDRDVIAAVYVLTSQYLDVSVCDELMCESIISRYSFTLNQVMALLLRSGLDSTAYDALILKLLANWGNSGLIEQEPIVKQEFRTHILICMCYQLSSHSISDLLHDTRFVTAISNHLMSLSNRVKSLGVFFADVLCNLAGADRIFNFDDNMLEIQIPSAEISVSDVMFDCDEAWEILESPQVEEPLDESDIQYLDTALAPVTIRDQDLDIELDDPSMSNEIVNAPVYVRDILAYLTADSKSESAYNKQRIALKTAPTLLRQKRQFGTEVSFFAEELITTLVGLANQYEESDFETLKLNCMIAVVVSHPDVTTHVCQLLLSGDYSLQQRMCLLSCLSLAARELRGYLDESVQNSFTKENFPSRMLPQSLHDQYTAVDADYGYSRIENGIQNLLMAEASEEARGMLGKVLRVSASLKKKTELAELSINNEDLTRFNKMVGKQFFFPLVAVWYESRGIDIGPYTPILVGHFLRTLSLILHTAYPAAVDLRDMAREYIGLVTPVFQSVNRKEEQVIESIATGVLLVCDMFDSEYLVNFESQFAIIENAVGGWWDTLIDERVKSLCAGLLLRISGIRTDMKRTIMDQNGFI